MTDETEQYWLDLVQRLKRQLEAMGLKPSDENKGPFHNRIWETVSEAYQRGKKS